jgi:hypothetical protein
VSSQSEYAGSVGTGNFTAGTASAWGSTGNATGAPDGSYATDSVAHNQTTPSLDVYNWGFSIPGGATINGVACVWTALQAATSSPISSFSSTSPFIKVGSTSGSFTTNTLASSVITTSSATYTAGSSTDLAGLTSELTVSNVNSNVENTGITLGVSLLHSATVTSTVEVDACQCTVYYTASAPGTPTNLVASYSSPTAVTLTWTQGSGSPTDNPIEYGTDGTTFGSSADPGSAVTTYTVTGLTTNQLYFFKVAASNSGGTSAYTAPVPFVCGWNLAVQVSASSDDAYQTGSTVTINDASKAPAASSLMGWRFLGVANAGLPIVNAALYFYLTADSSPAGSVSFDCQLSTAPATFTTASNNISARALTGAGASFAASAFGGTGWNNVSGSFLANALATLFNQPGWASGDNVAVIASFNASFAGLTFEMEDGNTVQAAILAIQTGNVPVWNGLSVTGCAVGMASTW